VNTINTNERQHPCLTPIFGGHLNVLEIK